MAEKALKSWDYSQLVFLLLSEEADSKLAKKNWYSETFHKNMLLDRRKISLQAYNKDTFEEKI